MRAGARRFLDKLIARVRRAGGACEIVVRVDSGFWSKDTIATLGRLGVRYTMAVRTDTKGAAAAIAGVEENAWRAMEYTPDGEAQVAECTYHDCRLIVRRTRLTDIRQARLWPTDATSGSSPTSTATRPRWTPSTASTLAPPGQTAPIRAAE